MALADPVRPAREGSAADARVRTARVTGLLYLGLLPTGALGSLLIRPELFAAGDPEGTLAQLVEHQGLARLGVGLELGLVAFQSLTALWFYRLFRPVDPFAAGALAAFGLVNAVALLGSAAALGSALEIAGDPVGDAAGAVQLMYLLSGNLWGVGSLFFGLWLVPMGLLVLRSGWMPRTLGRVLVGGGLGYVLSAFAAYLLPDAGALVDVLVVPATVGELWMIGYLLTKGVNRRGRDTADPARSSPGVPAPVAR